MLEIQTEIKIDIIPTLREVSLVGNTQILPYENAEISLSTISILNIHPSAFYVLKDNLNTIFELYKELKLQGIDLYLLESPVQFNGHTIAPPVLEMFQEKLTIVDGAHRIYIAKQLGIEQIRSVVINNPSVPLPVLPLDWSDVKVTKNVPAMKRIYNPQIPKGEHSLFYRDLSTLGSTGERKPKSSL